MQALAWVPAGAPRVLRRNFYGIENGVVRLVEKSALKAMILSEAVATCSRSKLNAEAEHFALHSL
jgi:hypothetical protein